MLTLPWRVYKNLPAACSAFVRIQPNCFPTEGISRRENRYGSGDGGGGEQSASDYRFGGGLGRDGRGRGWSDCKNGGRRAGAENGACLEEGRGDRNQKRDATRCNMMQVRKRRAPF